MTKTTKYTIIVTAENSHGVEEPVSIQNPDEKGKVIEFSLPKELLRYLSSEWQKAG